MEETTVGIDNPITQQVVFDLFSYNLNQHPLSD